MSRTSQIAAAIALLAVGWIAGALFVRRNPPAPRPAAAAPRKTAPEEPAPEPAPELVRLQERVRILERQLAESRELPSAAGPKAPPGDLADRILDGYLRVSHGTQGSPDEIRELLARIARMDESCTAAFIGRFRDAGEGEEADKRRSTALELALAAGGPEAVDFIHTLLHDPNLKTDLRADLLKLLSGNKGPFFTPRRLPVDAALAATAMTLAQSARSEERAAAAGLLGGRNTDESRLELQRILERDPDGAVRTTAVRSLAIIGNRGSRYCLEALARSDPGLAEEVERALRALSEAGR